MGRINSIRKLFLSDKGEESYDEQLSIAGVVSSNEIEEQLKESAQDGLERLLNVDTDTNICKVARYNKSFKAKLIQSDNSVKGYYFALRNRILSYSGTKKQVYWNSVGFHAGNSTIAKFVIDDGTLCMYLALDPEYSQINEYNVEAAKGKKYGFVPCLIKLSRQESLKDAGQLINLLADKFHLTQDKTFSETCELPYEHNEQLVDEGLIKQHIITECYTDYIHRKKMEKVQKLQRSEVSASEADNILKDEQISGLVEEEYSVPQASGKCVTLKVDALDAAFGKGEVINLQTLKNKKLVGKNAIGFKVLAHGKITKPLIIEADDFSAGAVKMILLTGGKAIKV